MRKYKGTTARMMNKIEVVLVQEETDEVQNPADPPNEHDLPDAGANTDDRSEATGKLSYTVNHAGEIKALDEVDALDEVEETKKTSNEMSRRRRLFALIAVLLMIVGVILGFAIVKISQKNKSKLQEAEQKEDQLERQCVEDQIADLNENRLELSLVGLSRPATESEQVVVEQAVLDAYNDVSGRCDDVFERWMYQTNMINQTLVTVEGDGNDNFENGTTYVLAELEMDISCYDCPEDEEFASIYVDQDTSSRRKMRKNMYRGLTSKKTSPASLPAIRKLQTIPESSTISFAEVVSAIDMNLRDASAVNSIEGGFINIAEAYVRSSSGKKSKAGGKGGKGGKGKGGSGGSKKKKNRCDADFVATLGGNCCLCGNGKPVNLELEYVVRPQNSQYQPESKASCTGDLNYPEPATFTVSSKKGDNTQTFSNIMNGDVLTITGIDSAETTFEFTDGTECYIHTSCSAPIIQNDQIGPFKIVVNTENTETCGATTNNPTLPPTRSPTAKPTAAATTSSPTPPTGVGELTDPPTRVPTSSPTRSPTRFPTRVPTSSPTRFPTRVPTSSPTRFPTRVPTSPPTRSPTAKPSPAATTASPTPPTGAGEITDPPTLPPTRVPTSPPTRSPTAKPTAKPSPAATTASPTPPTGVGEITDPPTLPPTPVQCVPSPLPTSCPVTGTDPVVSYGTSGVLTVEPDSGHGLPDAAAGEIIANIALMTGSPDFYQFSVVQNIKGIAGLPDGVNNPVDGCSSISHINLVYKDADDGCTEKCIKSNDGSGIETVEPGALMGVDGVSVFNVCCDTTTNTAKIEVIFKDGQICSNHPNPRGLCSGAGSFGSGNALYIFEFDCMPP